MPSLIGNKPNQVPSNGDLGTLAFQDANAVNITGGVVDVSAGTAALPTLGTTGDENTGVFFPAADTVAVSTNGVERMRIDSSGVVELAQGQLKFPATQVASADANTLDDYEEGTWTPTVGGTATYSRQEGSYTKIGRVVTVRFDMTITLIGTGSTQAISGLPFGVGSAATSEGYGATGYFSSLATNVIALHCYGAAGTSLVYFNSIAAAGATATQNTAIFGNSTRVQGSLTYFV